MSSNNELPATIPNQSFSLAPRDLTEAMKFADMMAKSELVPKCFRGKPGDVLIAVQMGNEVGLAAMASIQNIAVINGKPGIYGDAGKAILLANGCIIEEDDIEIIKAKGRARCKITRRGRPPVERTFSIDNAKTAGLWNKEGPWRNYPERQMSWRAFWFAARDAAADLLKGLGGAEELADIEPRDMGAAEVIRDEPVQQPRSKSASTTEPAPIESVVVRDEQSATPAELKPMTDGMKKMIRVKLEASALTETDLVAKFGAGLDELDAGRVNEVLEWAKNPNV